MAKKSNNGNDAIHIKALKLCEKGLKDNYGSKGIFAGQHQFRDYWCRDSVWASFGALSIKDFDIVKRNIQNFLSFEKNGEIPLRIGNKSFFQTFLGKKVSKSYPMYNEDKNNNKVLDSGSLLIIIIFEYDKLCNDKKLIIENSKKINRIIKYYLSNSDNYFLYEKAYAGWMDSVKKTGRTFYTNLLLYIALEKYSNLFKKYKIKSVIKNNYLKEFKQKINELFWKEDYFVDWIDNKENHYFDTYANLLAIYFDFANKEQKNKIFNYIKKEKILKSNGRILKNYPRYPEELISKKLRLLGLRAYSDGVTYPWMSFFYFLCLKKENKEWNTKELSLFLKQLIKDETIHECYKENKPYKTLIYYSEHPFAWACGFGVKLLI